MLKTIVLMVIAGFVGYAASPAKSQNSNCDLVTLKEIREIRDQSAAIFVRINTLIPDPEKEILNRFKKPAN